MLKGLQEAQHLLANANVSTLANKFGLDDGRALRKLVQSVLIAGGVSPTVTMGEIGRLLRKEFVCMCTDLQTSDSVALTPTSTPSLRVCDAVYMSCSVPFVFAPMYVGGHVVVDGCMSCNLPQCFPEDETLYVFTDMSPHCSIQTWPDFLQGVMHCAVKLQWDEISAIPEERCIRIKPVAMESMFVVSADGLESLLRHGYASAVAHLTDRRVLESLGECAAHVAVCCTKEDLIHGEASPEDSTK